MHLEPRDIHEKQFHDAWRGYNQEEVDDFLDDVAETLDRVLRENHSLHQRIEELESQVSRAREAEEMLKKTLVGAQRAAEEAIETARGKAERLIAEAEERARRQAQDAQRRSEQTEREHAAMKRDLETSIARLRAFESDLKQKLRSLLEEQMRALERLDSQPPARPPQQASQPPVASPHPLRATPSKAAERDMPSGEPPSGEARSFSWRQR
ncbi:MAG: DivIVA domain-containing protein [Actinomycetota bacterium]